jgi:hypothetical protein
LLPVAACLSNICFLDQFAADSETCLPLTMWSASREMAAFRLIKPTARREGSAYGSERKRYFVNFYETIKREHTKKTTNHPVQP